MKLIDSYANWKDGFVFSKLASIYSDLSFLTGQGLNLDFQYMANNSGNKETSTMVDLLIGTNERMTDEDITRLANILYFDYGDKWKRLYEAITKDYNIIENYNSVESETSTGTGNTQNKIYGFNSDDPVNSTDASSNGTNTRTLTRKGNIGVTTSQQMIESEFQLRKHNFYKILFEDCDMILTANFYKL